MIRPALVTDAEAACDVLRRSITELCIADHRGAPEILDGWLENKTPDTVRGWIESGTVLVDERDARISGVAMVDLTAGWIGLNYVAPEARGTGVSTALLGEMERLLAEAGHAWAGLTSTGTAHSFYLSRGYSDQGGPQLWRGGNLVYPMSKALFTR